MSNFPDSDSLRQARFARNKQIRAFYAEHRAELLLSRDEWGMPANLWNSIGIALTPIEDAMWYEIRCANMVMYPQYPVGQYFVDFGNPAAKVAIECDGRDFHLDAAKDAERQAAIEAIGWTVYRATGSLCNDLGDQYRDAEGETEYADSDLRRFVREIGERHRICRHHQERSRKLEEARA